MSDATLRTDILVIGAGPAGIAAAARAAALGHGVLLVDEGLRAGGQIWRHRDVGKLPRAARRQVARLEASGARPLYGASVVDLSAERSALLEVDGRPLRVEAGTAVILCTGARERFIPFPGWTLPGVVGVGGAQALLKAGLNVHGRRVVIGGTGPLLLPVAAAFARAGAQLALVAEQAPAGRVARFALGLWRSPGRLADAARYRASFVRAPYRTGSWVAAAHGSTRVSSATLAGHAEDETVPCDLLCVGYGLVPATELPRLVGCALHDGMVLVTEQQETTVPGIFCAGEPTGVAGAEAAVTQGEIAGYAAAGHTVPRALLARRAQQLRFAAALETTFALRPELRSLARADTFVCRCEDITRAQVETCGSIREARLHTRIAMGPCQGRVCTSGLEVLFGWTGDTVRPPVEPALIGTLAAGTSTSER